MHIQQRPTISALSPGGVAPCEPTVVPYYPHTFSGQSSPVGPTLSITCHTCYINLSVFMLWFSPVSAGSSFKRGGWGGATAPCRSAAREPRWRYPHYPPAGETSTMAVTSSPVLGDSFSFQRALSVPHPSLCSLSPLLVVQKLFGWLTAVFKKELL